ncbi:hypothetical protein P43SY_006805 [Pythium insidiosum]|uniref:Uncharacterized protein n=1 Tax=Pythium insidiosum TaxID=114742 RepID=A0AAD5LIA8_PYTIN|nr:hypothetical protein P43SY_006805 [Pythium insidiosum]
MEQSAAARALAELLDDLDSDSDVELDERDATPLTNSSSSSSSSGSSAVTSEDDGSSNEPREVPVRAYRQELLYLRGKAQALEETLRVLKRQRNVATSATASSRPPEGVEGDRGRSTHVWERLAMRQFAQRQRSEDDNKRLRRALQNQLKLARSFERLLRRSNAEVKATQIFPSPIQRSHRVPAVCSEVDDHAAFEELSRVVDAMQHEREAVFSDPIYAQDEQTARDVQVRADPHGGTVVDVFDARTLPFPIRPTADAVWSYFATAASSDEASRKVLESTETTLKKHFSFLVQTQLFPSRIHRSNRVPAAFSEADDHEAFEELARVVDAMQHEREAVFSDPIYAQDEQTARDVQVRADPHGGTVVDVFDARTLPFAIRPTADAVWSYFATAASSEEASRKVLDATETTLKKHFSFLVQKTGLLTDFVLQSVYTHLQTSRRMIENVLVDASVNLTSSGIDEATARAHH